MWNFVNLARPVDDVCEYGMDDGLILGLPDLVSLLTAAAEVLTKDHPIWTEIKVFRNVQAKYKRILHCDKALQLLQRVGSCVRKMVLLNLSKSYLDLAEHILVGIQNKNSTILIPSRQQLEYVLLRSQSAAKLICDALHYSRETFCYLIQRLSVGHLILNLMMATSVTARINIMFKGILVQIIDMYRKLYSWCNKLKVGTWEWPQPVNLPEDLENWLKPQESDVLMPDNIPKQQLSFLTRYFQNQRSGAQNGTDSVVEIESENECVIIADTSQPNIEDHSDTGNQQNLQDEMDEMDTGEVILRPEENTEPSVLTEAQKQLLAEIKGAKSFKKLQHIWTDIDNWIAENALPRQMTPAKIRMVDKMFVIFQEKLNEVKGIRLTDEERKKQNKHIKKIYRLRFARHLALLPRKSKTCDDRTEALTRAFQKLKPVETFKDLKKLYNNLYNLLHSSGQNEKCRKLKKFFRSRKPDIELLLENKEKILAKHLIECTSSIFLARFRS